MTKSRTKTWMDFLAFIFEEYWDAYEYLDDLVHHEYLDTMLTIVVQQLTKIIEARKDAGTEDARLLRIEIENYLESRPPYHNFGTECERKAEAEEVATQNQST